MLRSRSDWPAAVVVDAGAFEQRLEMETQVLQGKRPPLPITAGLEEIAAFSRGRGSLRGGGDGGGKALARCLFVAVALTGLSVCGCSDRAAPKKAAAVSSRPSWADQVAAVRKGESRTVSFPRASKADWEMLRTGCEGLEVLEVDEELDEELELEGWTLIERKELQGWVADLFAQS